MLNNSEEADGREGDSEQLDQGLLPELLGRQIRVTNLAVFRLVEQKLAGFGITPQQFALLVIVERNPGTRQSLLAKARGLDKSTLVPMIDRLERDGLLERRMLASDRRIKTIWITQKGRSVLETALPVVREGDAVIGAALTPEERAELLRLMEKVRAGIGEE